MNDNYSVVFVPEQDRQYHGSYEGKDIMGNYKVVHNMHKTIEQWCECYPTALGIAEHFNEMLVKKTYNQGVGGIIEIGTSADDFFDQIEAQLKEASEDDEGGMLN
jgi:hypothetical protein